MFTFISLKLFFNSLCNHLYFRFNNGLVPKINPKNPSDASNLLSSVPVFGSSDLLF